MTLHVVAGPFLSSGKEPLCGGSGTPLFAATGSSRVARRDTAKGGTATSAVFVRQRQSAALSGSGGDALRRYRDAPHGGDGGGTPSLCGSGDAACLCCGEAPHVSVAASAVFAQRGGMPHGWERQRDAAVWGDGGGKRCSRRHSDLSLSFYQFTF